MTKPTHGNLVWMPVNGPQEVKMENQTWALLAEEKKRLELGFPKFYGDKTKGILKSRYRQL